MLEGLVRGASFQALLKRAYDDFIQVLRGQVLASNRQAPPLSWWLFARAPRDTLPMAQQQHQLATLARWVAWVGLVVVVVQRPLLQTPRLLEVRLDESPARHNNHLREAHRRRLRLRRLPMEIHVVVVILDGLTLRLRALANLQVRLLVRLRRLLLESLRRLLLERLHLRVLATCLVLLLVRLRHRLLEMGSWRK